MNSKLLCVCALVCWLTLIAGCGQRSPVESYFDQAITGREPYSLPGVSGYTVRAYEVVNRAHDFASVRITFASKAGTDLQQTKRFAITTDGRLRSLEQGDIDEAIRANLDDLASVAFMVSASTPAKSVDYLSVMASGILQPRDLNQVDSEDYTKAVFEKLNSGQFKVSVRTATGHLVTTK